MFTNFSLSHSSFPESLIIIFYSFLTFFFQINWINNYHALCLEKVGKKLQKQEKHSAFKWLKRECQPLG